ncbi:MAG: hypothetical protein ACRYG4_24035 [Janthinobacterium lividum]
MPSTRFDIVAQADSQTLGRLINYFAQQGLVPNRFSAVVAGGSVKVRIEHPDLGEQQCRIIAEKMRSAVIVEAVRVHRGGHLLMPLDGTTDGLSA